MITIGIPTFNRLDLVKKMAASLQASKLDKRCHIRIYDDASTDFDLAVLRRVFPDAVEIQRNQEQLGPDGNMCRMYRAFLQTEDQYFFNADADLLFCKDWLDTALRLLKKTDGILSVFNTPLHKVSRDAGELCEKDALGAAGTLFTRECLQEIMAYFEKRPIGQFDWQWSACAREKGWKLYTVKNSLVQHIGFNGLNSMAYEFAVGEGFKVDSLQNGQILNDVFLKYAEMMNCEKKPDFTYGLERVGFYLQYRLYRLSLAVLLNLLAAYPAHDVWEKNMEAVVALWDFMHTHRPKPWNMEADLLEQALIHGIEQGLGQRVSLKRIELLGKILPAMLPAKYDARGHLQRKTGDLLFGAAELLSRRNDWKGALACVGKMEELDCLRESRQYLLAAEAYRLHGNKEKALAYYGKALERSEAIEEKDR